MNQIEQLKQEVKQLQELQSQMNDSTVNSRKKGINHKQALEALAESRGFNIECISKILMPDFAGRIGYPSYALTNNNARINDKCNRIAQLTKKEERAEQGNKTFQINGGECIINYDADRIQLVFGQKPEPETITSLKKSGFKWSPTNQAWQRMITRDTVFTVNHIFKASVSL